AADSRICCPATGRYQAPRCARHGWARLGCAAWPRAYLGARAGTNGSGGSVPRACLEAMGRGARPSEAIRRGMKEGTILLNNRVAIALTSATTAVTAAALTATLGLAAASWVVAVRQMNGQMNGTNMGVATPLGSFAFFMALWVAMMAAMMLVARSVMSVNWMAGIAALVLAQKLLPAKATIDVPLGLAIVGLGLLIVVAPSSVPGLTPPMAAVIGGADLANLL